MISDGQGRFLSRRVLRFRAFDLPQATRLDPPFPNPGNPGTTIQFALHIPSRVKLEIFNILGQRVRKLLDEDKPAGIFTVSWDGENERHVDVSNGTYIVRLTTQQEENNRLQQLATKLIIQK